MAGFTIKAPVRSHVEQSFDDGWVILGSALDNIFNTSACVMSFEELYRTAYYLVLRKKYDELHANTQELITKHLKKFIITDLTSCKTLYAHHTTCLIMLRDILMYMDRMYEKMGSPKKSVYSLGLFLFKELIIIPNTKITHWVLELIKKDRDYEVVDKSLLKSIIEMFIHLGPLDSSLIESPLFPAEIAKTLSFVECNIVMELFIVSKRRQDQTIYKILFETPFIASTIEYYSLEAKQLFEQGDASLYLKKYETRLAEEKERITVYLAKETEVKLLEAVQKVYLVESNVLNMEKTGLGFMLDNNLVEDLKRAYRLYGDVKNGIETFKNALCAHLYIKGSSINIQCDSTLTESQTNVMSENIPLKYNQIKNQVDLNNVQESSTESNTDTKGALFSDGIKSSESNIKLSGLNDHLVWAEKMLTLKNHYDALLNNAFENDKSLEASINETFVRFVNQMIKAPEFIALYLDEHLRKFAKKNDEDTEKLLINGIGLFRFLNDKDVFERYFKNHLAKRLLSGKNISDDLERGLISKLRTECGVQFTKKMETMFNDLRISSEIMAKFNSQTSSSGKKPIELNANILTTTFWPLKIVSSSCLLPHELQECVNNFNDYYMKSHSGRKLTWHYGMGNVDLKAQFDKKRHELNVTTYQCVILLLFNTYVSLSYEKIMELTAIPEAELIRNLMSLSLGKFKILTKEPKSREILPTDVFKFNQSFTSPHVRIKIPMISLTSSTSNVNLGANGNKPETNEELSITLQKIDEDRKHLIDASVVRIMKARKKLDHNSLVAEVCTMLRPRFVPDPISIKKRIEALIDRDFLERTDERNVYSYVA